MTVTQAIWQNHQGVDYCVRCLLVDGMKAGPFDGHPEGRGDLRNVGLTSDAFLDWLARTVQLASSSWLASASGSQATRDADAFATRANYPPGLWTGSAQIQSVMREIWERDYSPFSGGWNRESFRRFGQMTIDALALSFGWPPTAPLLVFTVHYPASVILAVKPQAVVVSEGALDSMGLPQVVHEAVGLLSDLGNPQREPWAISDTDVGAVGSPCISKTDRGWHRESVSNEPH